MISYLITHEIFEQIKKSKFLSMQMIPINHKLSNNELVKNMSQDQHQMDFISDNQV